MKIKQGLAVVLGVILVFAAGGNAQALELLSHYKFDGNADNEVADAPDGTLEDAEQGSLPQFVAGKAGQAVDFDGVDDRVNITMDGFPNSEAGLRAGTLSVWFKTTNSTAATGMNIMGATDSLAYQCFSWAIYPLNNRISLFIRAADEVGAFQMRLNDAGVPAWNNGQWHHLLVTYDTEPGTFTGAMYLDGVAMTGLDKKVDTLTPTSPLNPWLEDLPLLIGATSHGTAANEYGIYGPFDGVLDDVQIYDSMIYTEDAQWLYNHPGESLEGSVTVYYPGDANKDRTVDEVDAGILADNWLATSADWSMGDFNEDTVVDDKDATMMASNWGKTLPGAMSVPEPSVLMLISAAVAMILMRKRIG